MLFSGSYLINADNTDIRKVQIIKILGSSKKKLAAIGALVRTAIKIRWYRKEILKKKVNFSLIVTIKKKKKRLCGSFICFDQNRGVTFSDQLKFLGTRIYGPISKEIRNSKKKKLAYRKVISLSKVTI